MVYELWAGHEASFYTTYFLFFIFLQGRELIQKTELARVLFIVRYMYRYDLAICGSFINTYSIGSRSYEPDTTRSLGKGS